MITDFDRIVESYMPAAQILGLRRADVASAVLKAKRFDKRCPSCQHSRAPCNVLATAWRERRLDIFNRRCTVSPVLTPCPRWTELEVPAEVLQAA